MLVQRQIVFNSLEPAVMSMRCPMNQKVQILVEVLDTSGDPVDEDLAAKLFLVARSSGSETEYAPSNTDAANGKVTFLIPAETLKDSNGYAMQLFADVTAPRFSPVGEDADVYRWLLASGVMLMLPAEE